MLDLFDTIISNNDTTIVTFDLTASEIVTSVIPALIGMLGVGVIAVLMLL